MAPPCPSRIAINWCPKETNQPFPCLPSTFLFLCHSTVWNLQLSVSTEDGPLFPRGGSTALWEAPLLSPSVAGSLHRLPSQLSVGWEAGPSWALRACTLRLWSQGGGMILVGATQDPAMRLKDGQWEIKKEDTVLLFSYQPTRIQTCCKGSDLLRQTEA